MSEEFEIPPDLAVFESQLRALIVAESKIDRDQLLYQSGWAAAMNLREEHSVVASDRQRWAWPAATAVFASLATMLAVMLWQQQSNADPVNSVPTQVAQFEDSKSVPISKPNSKPENSVVVARDSIDGAEKFPLRENQPQFSAWHSTDKTLTARSRINLADWEAVPVYEIDAEFGSGDKSTWALLKEMVPTSRSETVIKPRPNWFSRTFGEIL